MNFNQKKDIFIYRIHVKKLSAKWQPFCLSLNVLSEVSFLPRCTSLFPGDPTFSWPPGHKGWHRVGHLSPVNVLSSLLGVETNRKTLCSWGHKNGWQVHIGLDSGLALNSFGKMLKSKSNRFQWIFTHWSWGKWWALQHNFKKKEVCDRYQEYYHKKVLNFVCWVLIHGK